MNNIDKQAFRKQSVEGSFYLAECGYCGQVMPSSKLRVLHSPDGEADCYCPHCNAQDCEIFDLGTVGSEVVNAWNYQQKRIEALLDELEAAEKLITDGENRIRKQNRHVCELFDDNTALRQRIIELEEKLQTADKLQDSAFRHGLQHGFSLGQTDNQAGFEECLSAYGTGKGE
ncbi:ead/Ea22-like family protein [Enterobacter asburiae]|uniref:Ead/Ea22-like family protein n=1 Tax=Enterobacter asburiae TaxID=61645 RepID=A0A8I1G5P2_ENTAS|nr:ead/Ea22-like family protein [Enterobacter asburiae]MBJ6597472.1 ead/Ea22-like family protein [Enterobacter asburiae]